MEPVYSVAPNGVSAHRDIGVLLSVVIHGVPSGHFCGLSQAIDEMSHRIGLRAKPTACLGGLPRGRLGSLMPHFANSVIRPRRLSLTRKAPLAFSDSAGGSAGRLAGLQRPWAVQGESPIEKGMWWFVATH